MKDTTPGLNSLFDEQKKINIYKSIKVGTSYLDANFCNISPGNKFVFRLKKFIILSNKQFSQTAFFVLQSSCSELLQKQSKAGR